jgi:hypothetical protein
MVPQIRPSSPKPVDPPQKSPDAPRTQEAKPPPPGRQDESRFEAPRPKPLSLDGAPRLPPAPVPVPVPAPVQAQAQAAAARDTDAPASDAQAPAGAPGARQVYADEISQAVDKPREEWTHADAARYTDAVASQVEAHRDDPEFVNTLLTLAGPDLQRSAELLGDATESKFDRPSVEALASNFSRIGNAAPPETAARLAYGIASEIDDDSELNYVDDGLDRHADQTGEGGFRELVAAALDSQGKGEARDELLKQGGGGFGLDDITGALGDAAGAVGEVFEDLAGGAADVAGDVWDFGGDVAGAVVDGGRRIIGSTVDFAVDTANGTIDVLGDAAQATTEAIQEGVQFAVENGLKLGGFLLEQARGFIQDKVLDAVDVGEHVNQLQPGDTYSLGADVEVTAGVDLAVEGEIEVKRNEDGTFTVSAGLEADIGIEALAGVSVGAGGKAEFTFATAEEATRAAEALVLTAASAAVAVTPPFQPVAPLLAPSGDSLDLLKDNLSAVELSASASAELDQKLGLADTSGLSAEVEAETAYRVEFEDGQRYLVREQRLQGEFSAEAAGELLPQAGGQVDLAGATAQGEVTLSTRVELPDGFGDAGSLFDTAALLASPPGGLADLFPGAETSIRGELSIVGGGTHQRAGAQIEFEAPDVELSDGLQFGADLVRGRFADASRALPDVEVSGHWFTETGADLSGGIEVLGQGIDVGFHNSVRNLQDGFEVSLFS